MISGTHETLENQELQLRLELYDMVSEKILWQSNVTFPQAGILFLEQSVAPVSPPQKPSISEKKNPPEFQDRFDELSPNAGIKDPLQYKSDHEIKNQPSFEQNQRGFFSMILPKFISPPPLPPPPEGMVRIPEGEFVMGNLGGRTDEQPDHLVFIKSFFMDEHEVTNSDYLLCEKCERGHGGFDTHSPDQPVVYVDWHNANQYCLSQGKLALGKTVLVGIMPVNIDYRLVRRMSVKPSMPALTFFTKKIITVGHLVFIHKKGFDEYQVIRLFICASAEVSHHEFSFRNSDHPLWWRRKRRWTYEFRQNHTEKSSLILLE